MKVETYENQRLRKEFENIRKLASHKEMRNVLEIKYKDRVTGKTHNILEQTNPAKYPEIYIVKYKMPVYIEEGQLKKDWEGTLTITLTKRVFESQAIPSHPFSYNEEPFNQHVGRRYPNGICTGHIWDLAKHYGVWYFIIGIGGILNLEREWLDENAGHLNYDAHEYWKVTRKMEPTNKINWPHSLSYDNDEPQEKKEPPPVVPSQVNFGENPRNPTTTEPLKIDFGSPEKKESNDFKVTFDEKKVEKSNFNINFG